VKATGNESAGYRAIWRWHFYAGLFCVPFIIWLACTGAFYLWKPQVEALIDRPYDHLAYSGPARLPADQVRAAVAAVPGSAFRRYQLPADDHQAARVIVARDGEAIRVYVHPRTLAILKTVKEDDRLMQIVFRLHGELMMGDRGSYVVELAASWAIVMILTGLYLWWPRGRGPAGVVWPRLSGRGRIRWRDLHAVTGFWISFFALFLLLSGLPWTKSWGAYFREMRVLTGTAVARQDWPSGSAPRAGEDHAGHEGHMEHMEHGGGAMAAMRMGTGAGVSTGYGAIDLVAAAARQLDFAAPVMLAPPAKPGGAWTVASEAQNRPLRATATIDPASGGVVTREDFSQRHVIDRAVGYGIAAHEGQLFGLANQLLSSFVAIGLCLLSASAYVMWWRRRPRGRLGAPCRHPGDRLPRAAKISGVLLGIALPLFGASALVLLAVDRFVARRPARAAPGSGPQGAPSPD